MGFSHITLVNVDGRPGNHHGAQLSLAHSARELPGAQALLLSPKRPETLLDGIRHIAIQPLGYFEYSIFVIYALQKFIQTDFALIVQDDGWVLDGRNWRDEFLNYDYVGAPIHFARLSGPADTMYVRQFEWVRYLHDPKVRIEFVMNGGFSLRSRKLLTAPGALALPFVLPASIDVQGPPYGLSWSAGSHFEDVHLCIDMRSKLEQSGIRFAPLDLARMFAFEYLHPVLHGAQNLMQVLGHHCSIRKFSRVDPLTMHYRIDRHQCGEIFGESAVAEVFRQRGYKIEFA